jgi:ABC-type Fe3+-hydroxamate transport system substrate-binding protein
MIRRAGTLPAARKRLIVLKRRRDGSGTVIQVCDDVGRLVILAHTPRRVVSLVPSLTETLFALGCGDAIVGVTRYCTEPAGKVERIERVGGTKNPDVARIAALQPDLVLLNAEENRKEDFGALEGSNLNVFVSFSRRARDVLQLLRRLGELMGAAAAAMRLVEDLSQTLAELERSAVEERPRVFCPIWKNPWMSFNDDTYAGDMLSTAGGRNICAGQPDRYCRVTLEQMVAERPEVILLPDEPYVFQHKDLAALAPLGGTPACQRSRIHFIDGKALCWYGPRTAGALRYLRDLLISA